MSERTYTTRDKSDWGAGPWANEPDKIQWRDEATGLPCLVNRGPSGAWCGYVGVSPGHPAYEKDYDAVYDLFPNWDPDDESNGHLDVHGGLTYSRHCQHGPEDASICHVPEPGEPDNVWWLGFDCIHSGDYGPATDARLRQYAPDLAGRQEYETYRDLDYARAETTRLADQLAAVAA